MMQLRQLWVGRKANPHNDEKASWRKDREMNSFVWSKVERDKMLVCTEHEVTR